MTGNGLIAIASSGHALSSRGGAVRIEKARDTSDLRDRTMRDDRQAAQHNNHPSRTKPCQSETTGHVPLWYGPRLSPAFVAQVLGQLMNTAAPRDPRSVFAAYDDSLRGTSRMTLELRI